MNTARTRGILLDLDGVLYNADQVIPGAAEAIKWIQARAIPHLFVTNTTSRSRAALAVKLAAFGFAIAQADILTPAVAAAQWLHANAAKDVALFVPPSTCDEFQSVSPISEKAESGAAYVVVGDLGERWDYHTLNHAFRLLHNNPQAVLIALGMTRYWMTNEGISLDVAPFVAALEHATGRKALVFGKPGLVFFQAAAQRLELPTSQLLMIGDDIETDIRGAQSAGLKAALVRTGKFQPHDLDGAIKPDIVLGSIAELPAYFMF